MALASAGDTPRRRESSPLLERERSARLALAPLRHKIDGWQRAAAKLHAQSFHLSARQLPQDRLVAEAIQLTAEVREVFQADIDALSNLKESSRYEDITRAYEGLLATLGRLQQ